MVKLFFNFYILLRQHMKNLVFTFRISYIYLMYIYIYALLKISNVNRSETHIELNIHKKSTAEYIM